MDVSFYVRAAMAVIDREIELPTGYSMVWSGQFAYMENGLKRSSSGPGHLRGSQT